MLQCLQNVDLAVEQLDQGRSLDAAQLHDLDGDYFI